jgi:hypothetical protein
MQKIAQMCSASVVSQHNDGKVMLVPENTQVPFGQFQFFRTPLYRETIRECHGIQRIANTQKSTLYPGKSLYSPRARLECG